MFPELGHPFRKLTNLLVFYQVSSLVFVIWVSNPVHTICQKKSENSQNFAEIDEVNTVVVGETSNSPATLQDVPMSSEDVTSGLVQKDHDLTVAEKDYFMTSSEEDMDDLNALVNEKLQYMAEKGLEQLVGHGSMNVEEILCGSVAAVSGPNVGYVGNVGTEEVDQCITTSVCPGLTPSGNMESSGLRCLLMNATKWTGFCERR